MLVGFNWPVIFIMLAILALVVYGICKVIAKIRNGHNE